MPLATMGILAFSAIGSVGKAIPLIPDPLAAITFSVLKARSAVEAAFLGSLVRSTTTSLTFAPPSALMPPAALMSSTASCAPFRSCIPASALLPDRQSRNAILTSFSPPPWQPISANLRTASSVISTTAHKTRFFISVASRIDSLFLFGIVVETAAALAAKPTRLDHLDEQRTGAVLRIRHVFVNAGNGGKRNVQANKIQQLQRTHR